MLDPLLGGNSPGEFYEWSAEAFVFVVLLWLFLSLPYAIGAFRGVALGRMVGDRILKE